MKYQQQKNCTKNSCKIQETKIISSLLINYYLKIRVEKKNQLFFETDPEIGPSNCWKLAKIWWKIQLNVNQNGAIS